MGNEKRVQIINAPWECKNEPLYGMKLAQRIKTRGIIFVHNLIWNKLYETIEWRTEMRFGSTA